MFFFKQVDIDSDGFMTWAEFVNNCIESSNASTMDEKRQTSNSFKYTETQIKYTKDKLILRDSMYKTSQAKWVDAVQRVFVLEVGSNTVAVLHKDLTMNYIIEVLHPDAYTEKDARKGTTERCETKARRLDNLRGKYWRSKCYRSTTRLEAEPLLYHRGHPSKGSHDLHCARNANGHDRIF